MKAAMILHCNYLFRSLSPQLECGLLQGRNQILFISGSPAPNSGLCPEQVLNKGSLSRWINDCARKRYQDVRLERMRARPDEIEGNWERLSREECETENKMTMCSMDKYGGKERIPSGGNSRYKGRRGRQIRNYEGWGKTVPADV